MNDTKFTQSASIFQSSLYPQAQLPKFAQFAHLRKLREICQAFSDSDTKNGTLKFYSKLRKICSICPLSLQITQNSCNLRQFFKSQNLQQIAQNLLNLPTLITNQVKFVQSASIFQSSLYPQAQLPKFVQFALLRKLREIRQPFSDSDHRKWNSQILQQIAQNLLNLPTINASQAKFASSVPIPISSKSRKICAICPPSPQIM